MKTPSLALALALVPLTLAGCTAPGWVDGGGVPSFYGPGSADHAGGRAPAPLGPYEPEPAPRNVYAGGEAPIDLGIVDPEPLGMPQVGTATHSVQPTESGRLYVLELYQQVLDQRDALDLEVSSLLTELEGSRARVDLLEGDQGTRQQHVAELERENGELRDENRDLAGRLTTAQIRRLEAEKILLESKLEWQKALLDKIDPAVNLSEQESGVALREE